MSEKVWRNVPPEVIIRDIIESYDLPSAKEAMQNAAENFLKLPSAKDFMVGSDSVSETPEQYGEQQPREEQQRVVKFRAYDLEHEHMYENAWPVEHVVYVEMDKSDPAVQEYEPHMEEINGKWFYFIIAKDMALMQYTGLQDSQGQEIYEGDIIEFSIFPEPEQETKRMRDAIVFRGGCFALSKRLDLLGGMPPHRGIEVIGNVYEHSHLLSE